MESISSNHFSVDAQIIDALSWLNAYHPDQHEIIRGAFPEAIKFDGSWIDTEAMGVDAEWSSWLCDAIEATGLVQWFDGEPYVNVTEQDMAEMEGM